MMKKQEGIQIPTHILSSLEDLAADNLILADLVGYIAACADSGKALGAVAATHEQQH